MLSWNLIDHSLGRLIADIYIQHTLFLRFARKQQAIIRGQLLDDFYQGVAFTHTYLVIS